MKSRTRGTRESPGKGKHSKTIEISESNAHGHLGCLNGPLQLSYGLHPLLSHPGTFLPKRSIQKGGHQPDPLPVLPNKRWGVRDTVPALSSSQGENRALHRGPEAWDTVPCYRVPKSTGRERGDDHGPVTRKASHWLTM